MRTPPTGSSVHRALECEGSLSLETFADDELEAATGPARDRGVAIHDFLESVPLIGREDALLGVVDDEVRALCEALDVAELPTNMATEVAVAWNWRARTARELGRNLGHRDYASLPNRPDPNTELALTLDVLGVGQGRAFVGDYKSGHARLPRPRDYGQTMLGASCAAALFGVDEVVTQLIYIRGDASHWLVTDTVDQWDLDIFRDRVEEMMYRSMAGMSGDDLVEGSHCDFCPSFRGCPKKLSLVKAVPEAILELGITGAGAAMEFNPAAITMAKAANAYLAVEKLEELLKRVKSEVVSLARHHPVDLGDGRVIEPHETVRRDVKPDVAWNVLTRRYGAAAKEAFELDTSLSAIQRVVVAHKPSGQKISTKRKDGAMDVVVAEIDAAGGIVQNRTTKCSPHRPKT